MLIGNKKRKLEFYERQASIIDALNKTLGVFCSFNETTFCEIMRNGVRPIAGALGVSRITFYRHVDIKNEMRMLRKYRWDETDADSDADTDNAGEDEMMFLLPANAAIQRWVDTLGKNRQLNLRLSEVAEGERDFMVSEGIKSLLAAPVFIQGEFWGGVFFQDHKTERVFDEDGLDFIFSAARMCVNALNRNDRACETAEVYEALDHSKKMTDVLIKTAVLFLSHRDESFEKNMTAGVDLIVGMVGIDGLSVWRNSHASNGTSATRIYSWYKNDKDCACKKQSFDTFSYAEYAPEWEALFQKDRPINSPVRLLHENPFLYSLNMVSIFATPIYIENSLWGFMVFGDCKKERYFDEDGADMMRSVAFLCANAIIQKDLEREVTDKNELSEVMFEAAPIGLVMFDGEFRFVECNETLLSILNVTEEFYINNFIELSPEYQPDGSKSYDRLLEIMKQALNGEKAVIEWMHRTPAGEPIPCEITLTRIKYRDVYMGLGYVYDLRNIKKMERDIKHLETEAEKIYIDALTGINNRRFFDENLKRVIKSLSRPKGELSLMMIDIDYFKRFNDTYGHSEGDKCLRIIAKTLAKSVPREGDFVARYGGEEFAVVLPNTGEAGARKIAEKLLRNILNCKIPHVKNDAADYVTISIGLTTGVVNYMQKDTDYIVRADEMLYLAKENGRNRYYYKEV